MAQPFDCFCGAPSCRGRISGAKDMSNTQLEGLWLNGHVRDLKEQQQTAPTANGAKVANGVRQGPTSRELSGEMGGDTVAT